MSKVRCNFSEKYLELNIKLYSIISRKDDIPSDDYEFITNQLHELVRTSTNPYRYQLLISHYRDHKSVSEIADELGVCKSTISRTLQRAKDNVLRDLSIRLDDPDYHNYDRLRCLIYKYSREE